MCSSGGTPFIPSSLCRAGDADSPLAGVDSTHRIATAAKLKKTDARALAKALDALGAGEPNDADLVNCYQQCDLFVLPNRQVGWDIEGFGMVLLEAQACGKPVIAGASGGT